VPSKLRALRDLCHLSSRSIKLGLCLLLVQVLAASNKKLQGLVNQIVASGDSNSAANLVSLSTQISKLAAVQQDDMSTSIATLANSVATRYAADPAYNPALELATFSTVRQLAASNQVIMHSAFSMQPQHCGMPILGRWQVLVPATHGSRC
jgi:hypothetical protein